MAVYIPGNSRVTTKGRVVIGPSSYGMSAVGGDITTDISISGITYRVHRFNNSGILTVTTGPTGTATIEYLAVGGGGGGLSIGSPQTRGAGGGAGGFITGSLVLSNSGNYTVTIGSGGSNGTSGNPTNITPSSNPNQILLFSYGGGSNGAPGGSGGGGSGGAGGVSISNQGFPGGSGLSGGGFSQGGAGGGAGGAGASNAPTGAIGGAGKESLISGYPEWFAAGGGSYPGTGGYGGSIILGGYNPINGYNGYDNTGSGGGGATFNTTCNGGKGIVIIRYRTS